MLIYIFLIDAPEEESANLVSTTSAPLSSNMVGAGSQAIAQDFLTLLLSVKNIKLDDSIFSNEAFVGLRDSSIVLTPDGNEGRPNPFAPLGSDLTASTISAPATPQKLDTPQPPVLP